MSFYFAPGVGTFHLQEVAPRRVVPGPERHRWDCKPRWGEAATCTKCGCEWQRLKTRPDYTERWRLAGTTELLHERPACTGGPAQKPLAPPPAPGLFDASPKL